MGQSKYLKPQAWKNKWKTKRNRESESEWGGRTNVYLSCSGGFSIIFLKWTEQAKELLFRQRAEPEMTYNEWTHQNGIPQPYFSVHTKKGLRRKLLKNIRLEGIVVHDPSESRKSTKLIQYLNNQVPILHHNCQYISYWQHFNVALSSSLHLSLCLLLLSGIKPNQF